jgi:hypothetical protein
MGSTNRSRNALHALGAAVIAALVAGCGAKVAIDRDGGLAGVGGAGGDTTTGGSGGGAHLDGGCAIGSSGAGAGQMQTTECFATPPEGCPNQYDAVLHIVPSTPCVYLVSVDCGPLILTSKCCYVVTEEKKTCGAG